MIRWIYDMSIVPKNTPVQLLSDNDWPILPQNVYIGTITEDGRRGELLYGNPEYFYRSKIIAWYPLHK